MDLLNLTEFLRNSSKTDDSITDAFDKDPLYSHCYQVIDCQKNNFVNKWRLTILVGTLYCCL